MKTTNGIKSFIDKIKNTEPLIPVFYPKLKTKTGFVLISDFALNAKEANKALDGFKNGVAMALGSNTTAYIGFVHNSLKTAKIGLKMDIHSLCIYDIENNTLIY